MRAYCLHSASWARIVTQRVRRPESIGERLATRRRRDVVVPADGQLVLLACNHKFDPRTGEPVDRRELLDRIIEALSTPEVDGVVASADLLEELTLLNVLEHRLAFCAASSRGGVSSSTIVDSNFDGAARLHRRGADIAELAACPLPTIFNVHLMDADSRAEFDTDWSDWIEPIHEASSAVTTGAGVWMTVPAVSGLARMAEATGFPLLIRDTDLPIHPDAWQDFFEAELPLNIRGMVPGVSALFPFEGSVAEATATIARAVRNRVTTG